VQRALTQGLIQPSGLTPAATMGSRLYTDTKQEGSQFVRASDGFHTAKDISDGFFTVPRRPPTATISLPAEGASYTVIDLPTLLGQGHDPEDGSLPDVALTWYDGAALLGSGRLLGVGSLPPGRHVITLRVQDSDGNIATDSRTIQVGLPVYLPLVVRR
jgi:hypothetical protein